MVTRIFFSPISPSSPRKVVPDVVGAYVVVEPCEGGSQVGVVGAVAYAQLHPGIEVPENYNSL